jgi:hypothetical protein
MGDAAVALGVTSNTEVTSESLTLLQSNHHFDNAINQWDRRSQHQQA